MRAPNKDSRKYTRSLVYVFLMVLGMSTFSCKNYERAINSGDYDQIIFSSVEKLRKNKKKQKQIIALEEAYAKANKHSFSEIEKMLSAGSPAYYKSVYTLYQKIEDRQNAVEPLLPLYIKKESRNAVFERPNVHAEVSRFRTRAAEYLYANAQNLLETNNKMDARDAYRILNDLDNFYPNFRDTRNLMAQANFTGSNFILFEMKNRTNLPLPKNFESQIKKLNLTDLDQLWAEFHLSPQKNINYDYKVVMNINDFFVSPERLSDRVYPREKEIIDGWQYVLDKNGNVMKDSLGNDIKVDIIQRVRCEIIESAQSKEAGFHGTVDFENLRTNQIIANYPVNTRTDFQHLYGTVRGDMRALNKNDRVLCDALPLPFPTDQDMLIRAGLELKPAIERIIRRNDDLVLN